ncbi:hypothetical protein A2U01_0007641, partial [Trifolium medium]|nr:hypothetical protein [Trifolium medium]
MPLPRKRILNLYYRGSIDQSQPSKFARSRLIATTFHSFTPRGLKNSFKQRFKGSSSMGQSSRTSEGLRLLEKAFAKTTRVVQVACYLLQCGTRCSSMCATSGPVYKP